MKPTRKCNTPNCDREICARGMCRPCYGKAYRAGKIQPALFNPKVHSLSSVDAEARTAVCSICGPTWVKLKDKPRAHECMRGSKPKPLNPDRPKGMSGVDAHKWDTYGLTPDGYAEMWLEQDGRCAICETSCRLNIDHCHETGQVRALLCHRCNVALGWMNDSPHRLRVAAKYIERF